MGGFNPETRAKVFSKSLMAIPHFQGEKEALVTIILILFFIFIEWLGREKQYAIAHLGLNMPKLIRWTFYSFIIFSIGMFMQTKETPFIYFKF